MCDATRTRIQRLISGIRIKQTTLLKSWLSQILLMMTRIWKWKLVLLATITSCCSKLIKFTAMNLAQIVMESLLLSSKMRTLTSTNGLNLCWKTKLNQTNPLPLLSLTLPTQALWLNKRSTIGMSSTKLLLHFKKNRISNPILQTHLWSKRIIRVSSSRTKIYKWEKGQMLTTKLCSTNTPLKGTKLNKIFPKRSSRK